MAGLSTTSSSLTTESCVSFCGSAGYAYSGTEYGQECYCSDDLPTELSTGCTSTCSGDATESCGGSNALSVRSVTSPATVKPAYALGCYVDNVNPRALGGSSTSSTGMTNEICQRFCQQNSYSVSGTEYGSECYCGTAAPNTGLSTSCVVQCAGNSTETCGGSNAISVSTTDKSLQNAVVSYSQGSFSTVGCFADFWPYSRSLSGPSMSSSGMTIETCSTFCATQGYAIFGLENSNQCFCAMTVPNDGSTACTMPCIGNSAEICGGSDALNVYSLGTASIPAAMSSTSSESSVLVPTGTSTMSSSFKSSPSGSNIGTTNLQTTLAASALPSTTQDTASASSLPTSSTTQSTTSSTTSASLSASTSTSPSTASSTVSTSSSDSSSTTRPTTSSSSSDPVSTSTSSSTASSTAPASPSVSASPTSLWSYSGCQTDYTTYRNLNSYSFTSGGLTIEQCQSACAKAGYPLAGMEYSTECYCASALRFDTPSTNCNMACGGDSTEICGGGDALSVYTYSGKISAPSTKSSFTTSNGDMYTYGGCWQDDYPYRVLSATSSTGQQSVELCTQFCSSAGYAYAGLEYYGECYCDNALTGSRPVDESLCDTQCAADSSELCGGNNVLSIYGTKTVAVAPYPSSGPAQKLKYKGHDISSLIMLEDGVKAAYEPVGWSYNQYEADHPPKFEQLLGDAGSNMIRIRLWTSPDPNNFDGTTYGLAYNVDLARRIVASGQMVMLDFHFSDDFADPSHNYMPTLWADLDEASLLSTITNYTRVVLDRFADESIPLEMITTGNEIRNGMVWPYGGSASGPNFENLAKVQNAIVAGVDASHIARPKILIHSDKGANISKMKYFFNGVFGSGLSPQSIDYVGLTWYPFYDNTDTQKAALDSFSWISGTYGLPIIVVETNWPLQCSQPSEMAFAIDLNINQSDPNGIPFTASGQKTWFYMIAETLSQVPNGMGQGLFNWESGWSNLTSLGTSCEQITMIQDYWYHYDATAYGEYAPICLLADSVNAFGQI